MSQFFRSYYSLESTGGLRKQIDQIEKKLLQYLLDVILNQRRCKTTQLTVINE